MGFIFCIFLFSCFVIVDSVFNVGFSCFVFIIIIVMESELITHTRKKGWYRMRGKKVSYIKIKQFIMISALKQLKWKDLWVQI